jgi:UDP:flavonoid glycosyltransferase YjiC (YdhE family)
MRVFILALGTRGDVQLFLMLGRELHRRGHHIHVGTSGFFETQVHEAGLEYTRVGSGTREGLLAILRGSMSLFDLNLRTAKAMHEWMVPQVMNNLDLIQSLAGQADYFTSNLNMVEWRGEELIPGAFVSYDPPARIADLWDNDSRRHQGWVIDLVAMNRQLLDPEKKWGDHFNFTGFWKEEEPAEWTPPEDLQAFLAAGSPPVLLTMGSMVMFDAPRLVEIFVRALRLAGQRGIIVGGWSEIDRTRIPAGPVYCAEEIPYEWLLPRTSCVIHHGGCGTVAAVLRAGKPSILLPQILPQEIFAGILGSKGLISGVFQAELLTPAKLAPAIYEAATNPDFLRNTQAWQQIVNADPGVRGAADLIEHHYQSLYPA